MPEMSDIIPWENVSWDNMSEQYDSGGGRLSTRPYYFRCIGKGKNSKILLISAVPSKSIRGSYHATDYLRLDRDTFNKLIELGTKVFND